MRLQLIRVWFLLRGEQRACHSSLTFTISNSLDGFQ